MAPKRPKPDEDLNLNHIVETQFEKAAGHLKLPRGLLDQIKVCNNVYYVQFPVKFGKSYEIFKVVLFAERAKASLELFGQGYVVVEMDLQQSSNLFVIVDAGNVRE